MFKLHSFFLLLILVKQKRDRIHSIVLRTNKNKKVMKNENKIYSFNSFIVNNILNVIVIMIKV